MCRCAMQPSTHHALHIFSVELAPIPVMPIYRLRLHHPPPTLASSEVNFLFNIFPLIHLNHPTRQNTKKPHRT